MDLNLDGKRVLVTGASRGLGKTIALLLAEEGAKVCAVARSRIDLDQLISEMGGSQAGHYGLSLDLTESRAVDILCQNMQANFGLADIIIHNLGGTLGFREPLIPAEDFQKVWYFNLGIAIEINRLLIPNMQRNHWGRVVHISSPAAVNADASLAYCAAKAAVNTYVKGFGREMAKYGIIVTAVLPGPFSAPGGHWERMLRLEPDKFKRFMENRMTALQRLGEPEEIGHLVAILCSDYASFMPGAVVSVDGGMQ